MPEVPVSPRRLLAVDADDALLELLQLLLVSDGYTVTTANSLPTARTALAGARPDLVLCDVRLPDAPPFALLDELAADPATARLPVLVLSGALHLLHAAEERLRHTQKAVLPKPFDIDELLTTVRRLASVDDTDR